MTERNAANVAFAARLKQLMEQRELTQSALAAKIWNRHVNSEGKDVARGRDRISMWIHGSLVPSPEQLEMLAKALGVKPDELVAGDVSEPLIHDPGNETEIEFLYAFMSIDDKGRHGVVAEILPGLGSTPLVTGSPKAVEYLKPVAQRVAKRTGKKVGLFAFKRSHQLWQSD